jgi:hypothetical protein
MRRRSLTLSRIIICKGFPAIICKYAIFPAIFGCALGSAELIGDAVNAFVSRVLTSRARHTTGTTSLCLMASVTGQAQLPRLQR